MKKTYKPGDKVTIRSWESMEKEWGLLVSGAIKGALNGRGDEWSRPRFLEEMRQFCGGTFVIKSADPTGRYYLKNAGCWTFVPEFFEETQEPQDWNPIDAAIRTIRDAVKDVEGAEVNICEDRITFMHGDADDEYILKDANDLMELVEALITLNKFKD